MVVLCGILLPLAADGPASASGARPVAGAAGETSTPWSVTATPTSNLSDGQRINLTIKTTADFPLYTAQVQTCRLGAQVVDYDAALPAAGLCPPTGLSSSGTGPVSKDVFKNSKTPAGASMVYKASSGQAEWTAKTGKVSLTCDSDHPCLLVVLLYGGVPDHFVTWTTQLNYSNADPIAGCGGRAPGSLSSQGSDRIRDLWVNMTVAACKRPGAGGAPTGATFTGEGGGVDALATEGTDIAYTGAGYNPEVKLSEADEKRPAVATPIALNATVLAVANGQRDASGEKIPFGEIKMTLQEAAILLSGGYGVFKRQDTPYLEAFYDRNPELAVAGFNVTGVAGPFVAAEPESTSWFFTNHLKTLVPNDWKVPLDASLGAESGQPRGADASFALARPSYATQLTTFTGRPVLEKTIEPIADAPLAVGGIWVLTDLATARALGMTPVSLANANGEFVAPTPASMNAAVATMRKDADGLLQPDPSAVAAGGAPAAAAAGQAQPYPLTFVEYALAPADPLRDDACAARPASQALLTNWLTYLTGDGQQNLPEGFLPLPAGLKAEAAQSIAKVGTAAVTTGPCKPAPPTLGPEAPGPEANQSAGDFESIPDPFSGDFSSVDVGPGAPVDAPLSSDSSDVGGGSGSVGSSSGVSSDPASTPSAATPAAGPTTTVAPPVEVLTVPAYAGTRLPNGVLALVALIAIAAFASVAAMVTSGRTPWKPNGGSS